jgi:hypothetical protein
MILRDHGHLSATEIAAELLRQRNVLLRHRETTSVLASRVADYEKYYEMVSSEIHDAIENGTLEETAEVCDWIINDELVSRSRVTTTR